MKSIKPGRGPSRQAAAGSVSSIIFGVIWTILAASMTGNLGGIGMIFPLFGLCFIGIGVYNAVYHYKNATSENRTSLMDIVDSEEEPDPWDQRNNTTASPRRSNPSNSPSSSIYCPWCGEQLERVYVFCPKCGRKLP